MFISKIRYDALIETISDSTKTINTAYEYIEKLKAENKQLRTEKVILQNMLRDNTPYNIDFPNSTKGGFEDSNIFFFLVKIAEIC